MSKFCGVLSHERVDQESSITRRDKDDSIMTFHDLEDELLIFENNLRHFDEVTPYLERITNDWCFRLWENEEKIDELEKRIREEKERLLPMEMCLHNLEREIQSIEIFVNEIKDKKLRIDECCRVPPKETERTMLYDQIIPLITQMIQQYDEIQEMFKWIDLYGGKFQQTFQITTIMSVHLKILESIEEKMKIIEHSLLLNGNELAVIINSC